MWYADRQGHVFQQRTLQDKLLDKLYGCFLGRMLLRPLIHPTVSRWGGRLLDSPLSALAVPFFVKAQGIDLRHCQKRRFHSYNDFFTRSLKEGARPLAQDTDRLISPCDGKLLVYPIFSDGYFAIKHTPYTVASLIQNHVLADAFTEGYAWIFRLSVEDYHRYIYVDDGAVSSQQKIAGVFHTVNPIANDRCPIYKENTREYVLLYTERFGTILMMEVGALLVGRIENYPVSGKVRRGQEKGRFAFGGSTIVLLTQKGKVIPDEDLLMYSCRGIETKVKQGEGIGTRQVN